MFPRIRAAVTGALLALPLGAAGATAATAPPSLNLRSAIVGGSVAADGAFPSAAFVTGMFSNGSGESCSGSVIAPDLVLTAGHCAENILTGVPYAADDMMVITGRANLLDDSIGQELPVTRVIINPAYRPPNETGDAALLQLGRQTTAPALPLSLAPDDDVIAAGTAGLVAGWGKTSETAAAGSTTLQTAQETIQPQGACAAAWGSTFDLGSQLCAQAPAQSSGTCNGDSGAPFIADEDGVQTELGLAVYVASGCNSGIPDVFTRTDAIAGWAEREVALLGNQGLSPTAAQVEVMTHSVAKVHSLIVLNRLFPRSVRGNATLRDSCSRIDRTGFLCTTAWTRGAAAYSGSVAVAYQFQDGQQVVVDHSAVHRIGLHLDRPDSAVQRGER